VRPRHRPPARPRAAEAGGGTVDPPVARLFDPGQERIERRELVWSGFVLAALIPFLLDLLMRRVRIFDRRATVLRRAPTRRR
jgi:hypothetical protein